jgi:hypothetical protein
MRGASALLAVIAVGGALLGAGAARADRADWVGTATCGGCHPAQLASWRTTAHASATARLGTRPAARCLACHGTGEAPAGPVVAAEVGCEACHGAGAHYAPDDVMRDLPLARALGLRDVSSPGARARLCATCHRAAIRLRPFDPQAPVHPTGAPRQKAP